jgi:hypothetical protein
MARCRTTLDIASPFVGTALCDLLANTATSTRITLLTRTRLVDFASGASNIAAVATLAGRNVAVLGLDRLHAKVYAFDDQSALVTSANATFSRLRKNAECGIAVNDSKIVKELAAKIRSGFSVSPAPTLWSEAQLRSLMPSVERLKSRLPTRAQIRILEGEEPETLELPASEAEELLPATAGWTQLVFQGLIHLGRLEFTTDEALHACASEIARRYPENRHPREKVRQQLQILRDLGLVHFLTPGHYLMAIAITP